MLWKRLHFSFREASYSSYLLLDWILIVVLVFCPFLPPSSYLFFSLKKNSKAIASRLKTWWDSFKLFWLEQWVKEHSRLIFKKRTFRHKSLNNLYVFFFFQLKKDYNYLRLTFYRLNLLVIEKYFKLIYTINKTNNWIYDWNF